MVVLADLGFQCYNLVSALADFISNQRYDVIKNSYPDNTVAIRPKQSYCIYPKYWDTLIPYHIYPKTEILLRMSIW